MKGSELKKIAAERGEQIFVLDDAEYRLGELRHFGEGRNRATLYQPVFAVSSHGSNIHIFSIRAEA